MTGSMPVRPRFPALCAVYKFAASLREMICACAGHGYDIAYRAGSHGGSAVGDTLTRFPSPTLSVPPELADKAPPPFLDTPRARIFALASVHAVTTPPEDRRPRRVARSHSSCRLHHTD